jgi:hypothetical protein
MKFRGPQALNDRCAPAAVVATLALMSLFLVLAGSGDRYIAEEARLPNGAARSGQLIEAIKNLEKRLGFRRTRNFSRVSDKLAAYYRCYYTGKLELPDSYEGLQLTAGSRTGCPLDPQKYDVFFYPIEAVASGKTPVTSALENASTERLLVVVPHEDFHQMKELEKLPATLKEAASTLVGFLAASEVGRQEFGPDSEVYRHLSREADLFSQKAQVVNGYHARLSGLYAAVRSGAISRRDALAEKEKLFEQLERGCKAISPDPRSFNKCLAANNNAGLAFDTTYTRYYPLMYEFYRSRTGSGRALREFIDGLKRALANTSEAEAVQHVQALIRESTGCRSP